MHIEIENSGASHARLTQILDTLKQHDADFEKVQERHRPAVHILTKIGASLAALCFVLTFVLLVAAQLRVPFPSVIKNNMSILSVGLPGGTLLGCAAVIWDVIRPFWKYSTRPILHLLPRVSDWIKLDHMLIAKLVSIGGIDELTTVERGLADEADAVEKRRAVLFGTLGIIGVGGIWNAAKTANHLQTVAMIAGLLTISSLALSIYGSQLRRYASVIQQVKDIVEKGRPPLAKTSDDLPTVLRNASNARRPS